VFELSLRGITDGTSGVVHSSVFTPKEHVNTLAPAGDPSRPHAAGGGTVQIDLNHHRMTCLCTCLSITYLASHFLKH